MTKPLTFRQARMQELEQIIESRDELTTEQYLALLKEIRKNTTAKLTMMTYGSSTSGSGALLNIIDKTHWLIDNVELKDVDRSEGDEFTVNVHFMRSEDD